MDYVMYGKDTIEYPPNCEEVIRQYLESEFGPVCKEHGGMLKNGNVWAYFTFQLGSNSYPSCFQNGGLNELSKTERDKRDPKVLYLWM